MVPNRGVKPKGNTHTTKPRYRLATHFLNRSKSFTLQLHQKLNGKTHNVSLITFIPVTLRRTIHCLILRFYFRPRPSLCHLVTLPCTPIHRCGMWHLILSKILNNQNANNFLNYIWHIDWPPPSPLWYLVILSRTPLHPKSVTYYLNCP